MFPKKSETQGLHFTHNLDSLISDTTSDIFIFAQLISHFIAETC